MDFREVIKWKQYDFLRTDTRLSGLFYLTVSGSYAYGTAFDNSDVDFRGVALGSPLTANGLNRTITKIKSAQSGVSGQDSLVPTHSVHDVDTIIHSYESFFHLLLICSPYAIELFGVPKELVVFSNGLGNLFRNNIGLFLTKKAFASFRGNARHYRRDLLRAMETGKPESKLRKLALHIIRVYLEGIRILRGEGIIVGCDAPLLRAIRFGEIGFDEVLSMADKLDNEITEAHRNSPLLKHPKHMYVDGFVHEVEGMVKAGGLTKFSDKC